MLRLSHRAELPSIAKQQHLGRAFRAILRATKAAKRTFAALVVVHFHGHRLFGGSIGSVRGDQRFPDSEQMEFVGICWDLAPDGHQLHKLTWSSQSVGTRHGILSVIDKQKVYMKLINNYKRATIGFYLLLISNPATLIGALYPLGEYPILKDELLQ